MGSMKNTWHLSKDLPPNAPAELAAKMGTDISPCGSVVTSSMEGAGFEEMQGGVMGSRACDSPNPHHCPTSCQHLTFPQRKQGHTLELWGWGWGDCSCSLAGPWPPACLGEMGGSPGDAIQALSLGGKSQRKTCIYNMNFPLLLPLS